MGGKMKTGKTRFWRSVIITVGILPGLWLYLGTDPQAQITYVVLDQIGKFISPIAGVMAQDFTSVSFFIYTIYGFGAAFLTWLGVYLVGGAWGLLAVGGAFVGAIAINEPFGIWLIVGALLAAPFLPVDEDHSLDTRY
jgi:hypothetical protein